VNRLTIAQTFIRKMTALEADYMRSIETKRRESRRVLLEIINRDGVSRASVGAMQAEIQSLRRDVTALGRETSRDIRYTVGNYTNKQIQMAQKLDMPVANLQSLEAANTSTQLEAEQYLMTSSPLWLDTLEANLEVAIARLRLSGAVESEILARLVAETGDRASLWRASGTAAATEEARDVWTYANALLAAYLLTLNEAEPVYKKQVIATIDERTTDCCLKAHGQIQPLDKPFKLTGTPRFSDKVQDPPFHWYCRSTEVLYNEAFEEAGVTTAQMRSAANAEIDAREKTKTRVPIYPSHATARRG
jgi:hypothetical protein